MSRSSSGRQDGLDGKLDWVAEKLHGVQLDRYQDMIERFGRDALDLVFNRIPLNCGIRLWSESRGNALYQNNRIVCAWSSDARSDGNTSAWWLLVCWSSKQ